MTRDKIKEGDICTLDESVAYSYYPHKPYEVVVLWHGVNSQPLVTKLDAYNPFWTTYSQLIEVNRHIDLSIKAIEQQTCEDAISRRAALDALEWKWAGKAAFDAIKALPSVQPKVKTGHWIYTSKRRLVDETDDGGVYITDYICTCSECGGDFGFQKMRDAYCKYCGAKMIEPQESEVEE